MENGTIKRQDGKFYSECACGWTGVLCDTEAMALTKLNWHQVFSDRHRFVDQINLYKEEK